MEYFIKTFGCQMNFSDSERIASFLESQGFREIGDIKNADLTIFNTCGIRQTAEDRVYGQIHNLKKLILKQKTKQKIVVTGCLAHRKDVQQRLKEKVDLFFPISDFKIFESWLKENYSKNKYPNLEFLSTNFSLRKSIPYLSILPKYKNKNSAFVPIMTGCNNFCSYCVVPYARGKEYSRPAEEIFEEIKKLSEANYKEITLLGQNVNSYKYELSSPQRQESIRQSTNWILARVYSNYKQTGMIKISFPILLDSLAKNFPDIKFNFLTSHPKDFSENLIKVIAENKNISRKIHLPIQSGSNKILKAMNRPYTQKYYLNLIKKAQKIISRATFTTDVIVGFPGETEEDFQETVEVFKKVGFVEAYINKYSPRPETVAFKLGNPISLEEKKRREKYLRKFIKK